MPYPLDVGMRVRIAAASGIDGFTLRVPHDAGIPLACVFDLVPTVIAAFDVHVSAACHGQPFLDSGARNSYLSDPR
jgi:hypothetical protein